MGNTNELDELIENLKEKCPDIVISQLTSFEAKPFESGVWKFWLRNNEEVYVRIEVQKGWLWAIYANKEFENKYPIDATKICKFLKDYKA